MRALKWSNSHADTIMHAYNKLYICTTRKLRISSALFAACVGPVARENNFASVRAASCIAGGLVVATNHVTAQRSIVLCDRRRTLRRRSKQLSDLHGAAARIRRRSTTVGEAVVNDRPRGPHGGSSRSIPPFRAPISTPPAAVMRSQIP